MYFISVYRKVCVDFVYSREKINNKRFKIKRRDMQNETLS